MLKSNMYLNWKMKIKRLLFFIFSTELIEMNDNFFHGISFVKIINIFLKVITEIFQ